MPGERVLTVGLVGGIGCGKSTVAALFAESGAAVLDADRAAHDALSAPEIVQALRNRFGAQVLSPDQTIDRKALAEQVFGPQKTEDRKFLESLIHPLVRQRLWQELVRLRRAPPPSRIVILDIPLLLEGPTADWCDQIVFIESSRDDRLQRVAQRSGFDDGELERRESVQLPVEEKRKRSHHVLVNSGTLADLRLHFEVLEKRLRDLASRLPPRMEPRKPTPAPPPPKS